MSEPETLIHLCKLSDLEESEARGFDPHNDGYNTLFIVRQQNSISAYIDRCPHQGITMPWRKHAYLNGKQNRIVCSGHGAEFDIATGECLSGPCLGQSLEKAPVILEDDGSLYLQYPS
jgi:nitrite reductase/ring-hydroxylating ferredoxin subunit